VGYTPHEDDVGILHMRMTSLVVVVTPRTGKIVKNGSSTPHFRLLKHATKWLQNGILHFVLRFSQSLEIALES